MQNRPVRTALFVPGNRPERFSKALTSGADVVIVDLEDSVEEAQKQQARDNLSAFLEVKHDSRVLVRVNMASHPEYQADLAVCGSHQGVAGILIPKAERTEEVAYATSSGKPIWLIIESALGLANLPELTGISGVERLTFGALDLSLDLGITEGTDAADRILDQARYAILLHSRLKRLAQPLDTVFPRISDLAGLESFARNARDMGFAGMLCIHPKQVPVVRDAFSPTEEELIWAEKVISGANTSAGAFRVDGAMVDAPVIQKAKEILRKAGTL